jgi:hypothetical protein
VTTVPIAAPGPAAINPSPQPVPPTAAPPSPGPAATGALDTDCATPGRAGFDLLRAKVEPGTSTYTFSAQYSGNASQHDIVVSFILGSSTYVVSGELFEDGTGVGQVADAAASDTTFLDPPQTIVAGKVELDVQSRQIASISGTPFAITVSLKVDGADVETCP